MTKNLFNINLVDNENQAKEDIRVSRILWFALGFISALVLIYIAIY